MLDEKRTLMIYLGLQKTKDFSRVFFVEQTILANYAVIRSPYTEI